MKSHSARGCAAARVGPALSLKTVSAPPFGISWNFEDHVLTSACSASPLRYGVTPKRDQRANTVTTKKTDKNAGQRARYEFHDHPAPAKVPYYRAPQSDNAQIRNGGGPAADDGKAEVTSLKCAASFLPLGSRRAAEVRNDQTKVSAGNASV